MPKQHTLIIDTSVLTHHIHSALVSAGNLTPEEYGSFLKAQLAWVLSGQWLGSLKPDSFQMVFAKDWKVDMSRGYWRTEYLKRPEVVCDIPRRTKLQRQKATDLRSQLETVVAKREVMTGLEPLSVEFLKLHKEVRDLEASIQDLTDDLAIAYKGGRKHPVYSFTKLKKDLYRLMEDKGIAAFTVQGYEADDVAALFCKVNSDLPECDRNDITLVTVDTDWLGLVSPGVRWFCMFGYEPRLREDVAGINEWWLKGAKGAHRRPLSTPADIWQYKAEEGDKSDNLPKGSPIEVIDLLHPPDEFCLWRYDYLVNVAKDVLAGTHPGTVHNLPDSVVSEATEWLYRNGFTRVIRRYEG